MSYVIVETWWWLREDREMFPGPMRKVVIEPVLDVTGSFYELALVFVLHKLSMLEMQSIT